MTKGLIIGLRFRDTKQTAVGSIVNGDCSALAPYDGVRCSDVTPFNEES